jgi:hypothetical protein
MSPSMGMVSSLSHLIVTLIYVLIGGALMLLGLTTVRRSRPDAAWWISGAGALYILETLTRAIVFAVLPTVTMRGGHSMSSYVTINAMVTFVFALINAFTWGVLLFGIHRLATSPSR